MELREIDQMVKLVQRFLEAQAQFGTNPEVPGAVIALRLIQLGQPFLDYLQEIGYGK